MKTSFALIVAATSVFVFTQAADAQCDCQQTVSYYARIRRRPTTTLRPLPTTLRLPPTPLRRLPTTLRPLPTTLRPLPTTLRRLPTTLRPLLTTLRRLLTTLRPLRTTLRPLPTTQLRRITPQPRHITGAVAITAVVTMAVATTAATIAADCSALAWAAGPVFVESTEGGIVAGGKRRGCRRSRSSWNRAKGHARMALSEAPSASFA